MEKRHQHTRVVRSDSRELDIPLRRKESRNTELPPTKRMRAINSPITPRHRPHLSDTAEDDGSARETGQRHSGHDAVPAQITPSRRRTSRIEMVLPAVTPTNSHPRSPAQARSSTIDDTTSLSMSIWAYLGPLLSTGTLLLFNFGFTDLQSTLM